MLRCIKVLKEFRLVFIENRIFERMRPPVTAYGAHVLHCSTLVEAMMMHSEYLGRLTVHNDSYIVPKSHYAAMAGCLRLHQLSKFKILVMTYRCYILTKPRTQTGSTSSARPYLANIRRLDLDMHEPMWPYFVNPKPVLGSFAKKYVQSHPLLKEMGIVR
jgi:hypothetical protein